MKLIAVVENVNQEVNENMIGDIILVDSELVSSYNYELCYLSEDTWPYEGHKWWQSISLYHEVSNLEIIGVL